MENIDKKARDGSGWKNKREVMKKKIRREREYKRMMMKMEKGTREGAGEATVSGEII